MNHTLTLEKLRHPHGSVPGNPLLAESLYLTKYIERMGTGTGDMITRCRKAGLKEPQFKLTDGFVITLRRKPSRAFGAVGGLESPTQSIDPVTRLLLVLRQGDHSAGDLRSVLKIKHRPTFRSNYLHPALKAGLIQHTLPSKPSSRLQRYKLTAKGRAWLDRK